MDLRIRNRRAIIAGASAGLGYSSAMALAREGVTLFISARGEERLRDAAETIARKTTASVTRTALRSRGKNGSPRIANGPEMANGLA